MTAKYLSPSDTHRHLMKQVTPELEYDGGKVLRWQRGLRRKVRQLTGYDAMPAARCDLRVRRLWRKQHALGTIEKIVFVSEPHAKVPAYLCLPQDAEPPYRCMIAVQGHNSGMHHAIGVERENEDTPIVVEGDRDYGIQCMKRGLAALCIEQRAFGERRELKQKERFPQICHDTAMHALMLGRTLIAERVYDVDRGIDYLSGRGDIDMKSIGIMGNSGGGATSLFAAALLPRLCLAAPGSNFCTYKDSIMSIRHCNCNFVPGLYNVADMADIMGLFAPKPVIIVTGKHDPITPVRATRKAFRSLQRIYEACGAGDHCHLVVGNEGHRYYADQAWPLILRELERQR